MATDDRTHEVLAEIFAHEGRSHTTERYVAPVYEDLYQFAGMIADEQGEESFQTFFERVPSMIAGAVHYGTDDSFLGMISKPRAGELYADFATFVITQGGAALTLVEIEKPHSSLFTRDSKTTGDLRLAENQVANWRAYIRTNLKAFVREKVEELCRAPMIGGCSIGSFRTKSPAEIRSSWQAFGGFDYEIVWYLVVCGRWSQLDDRERKLFLARSTDPNRTFDLRTYEQLARDSFTNLYHSPTG